ncbi:MAG: two component transcriptional regulator, LytTR family [Bacteroidetes bacterium]|jgi:DNA-binding LytR/AlgR family response regulator|nr:two component transcriptional regulator, LytTR family [Bacteroidota bacterium]
MIRAIAIDDEPPALKVIEKFCNDSGFIDLQKTFTQPQEALKYLRRYPVDLLFLDIQMPSVNGVDWYKSLNVNTMVVFTTAYAEYAVEGFNVNAIDYLLKPYTYERFLLAAQKAQNLLQSKVGSTTTGSSLLIRADYTLLKINYDSILFIEGLDDYLKIYLTDGKPVVVRMTMKSILEKLPSDLFSRTHKSFIVSLDKIESIRNKIITIKDKQIPIGNRFEESFLDKFQQ